MKHSRRARRSRTQKKQLVPMLLGIALLVVTLLSIFLIFLKQPSKQQNDSKASTVETTTSSSVMTSESSEVQTEIIWEQQTAPIKLPILMYHAIHVMAPEEEANANLIVDPTTFESHLKALQDAGYYTLSPEEAYKVLTENVLPAGKKVVWLTFDDSLWDFYSYAYPLLKQYQMKATNNVITGFTESGQAGHLTLEQIKEMQTAGLSFQGHTVNHPDLEYSSIEDQTNELTSSKAYLDSQLNQETIAIAYPGGRYSADTVALTEQAGYKLGVTTNNGLASASDGLLTLNRVRILPTTTAEGLLSEISY
ncbi:TPA: polysaccharide deacetylase family protein [Streptococcus suis]|uniref:polysaccharide deacetylase family protein n=1 Tax=Streptococcus suis TaxID=1307 RepID=UPI000492916D|nr:polysaccharide deacetylase family protein [Streptococcus suis]NQL53671.1 polysaccharide deacetylase family protein [Streptococcus suis]NQM23137.1 polysaccharide deacetylase family protein [Streptococcus suis]QZT28888.1 polysaccharide deacetylase family protein [Streptococcus suis]HEM3164403.1 polysaccharide deacetylase family protein [Streptococcus suis 92-1191]HEM3199201.1 polysaccharide deacetylase family protein [Streptococcus suis 14A]